jgi:beta-phosphoglucomutase family hydrolase
VSTNEILGFIFDMDGVIVDNHEYHFKAWMEFTKKYNFDLNEFIYRTEFNGKTNADLFTKIFGNIPKEKIQAYSLEKESNYQRLYETKMKPHTGLEDFLNQLLSKNYKIALGTSAPKTNVDFTLDKLGLREYFEVIVDGSQVSKGKPDPEVYTSCCNLLNLPPSKCLVFEDSIAGLQSGKDAGCRIMGVSTSHTKEELSGYVEQIIHDFTEVNRFLADYL